MDNILEALKQIDVSKVSYQEWVNVGMWPFESASKMVSRIAENNWFLPRGINATSYQPQEDLNGQFT